MEAVAPSVRAVGVAVGNLRRALGWTQEELGRRAGVSQSLVSLVENARMRDLTLATASRLLEAMGARMTIGVSTPFVADRHLQQDAAHARCSAYIAHRLRRDGWETAGEIEVGGDRSRGWIDLLAYHPIFHLLLVIEIKTEIRDLGAIERSLGWYEREGWTAARRLGWRPRQVIGCLLLLAIGANDRRVRENSATFRVGFPIRAASLEALVTSGSSAPPGARAFAMIDPRSQRRKWLRATQLDGRSTPAPYADYADFMRVLTPVRRRRRAA
jgi:transcriptional regulator with XRE-family HTH domain